MTGMKSVNTPKTALERQDTGALNGGKYES